MTTKLIPIRDKRNGVSAMLPEAYLEHPQWRDHFEAVRNTKPVVNTPKLELPAKVETESPKPSALEPKAEPKKGSK